MADTLDADRIAEGVLPAIRPRLRGVTVLEQVDSTNSELARRAPAEQHGHALLAERQAAGRGRGARRWHSPPGGNVYLSFGWRFARAPANLAALPLAVAVALAETLAASGLPGAGIKWPNDILAGGRKLSGILVESQARGGGTRVIAGIGINVRMAGDEAAAAIDRPWTDLESELPPQRLPVDRNRLVSALLDRLIAAFDRFEQSGFETFRARYEALDVLAGRSVLLEQTDGEVRGVAHGVDAAGYLRIELPGGETRVFHSGEVRVFSD